ncbi:MAG: oligosaccharide flippase family protein, partial [Solirubrobacteraceae bacterium]|nr:oligosaccharide flippase family protein [Solirubrobacteraceae bacterium]
MTSPDADPTLTAQVPGAAPVAPPPGDVLDSAEAGRRVMVGGMMRIGGYGLGLIASVIAAAVVFRYFGKDDYGRFSTVLALVTGLQIVTDLGITSLGVREYAQRTGEDRERFMRVLLGMRLVTTVLLLISTTAAALVFGYDETMIAGAALLGFAASIGAVSSTVGIPLAAEIRMGVITGIDVARQVATGVAYVALAAGGASMLVFFGVSVPIYLAVLATTFFFVRGTVPLRPIIDPRAWGELIAPTITFALASAAGSLYVYGAMVLTELVTDRVETSLFGAAFRVYIIISAFPVLLVTTAFPVLARAARDDRQRLTYAAQRLVEGTAILGGATVIALVIGAEPIILTLAGDKFGDAIVSMRIQGVALAITFVIATFGFTLMALHRHRAIIVCNALALTVSATTVLTLGSAHGADGASVGVLLGETTLLTAYLVALRLGPEPMRFSLDRLVRIVLPLTLGLACWF